MIADFTNDNVKIKLPPHDFSKKFVTRNEHEVVFRKINTLLIQLGIIQGNIIDTGAWIGDNAIPWAMNINKKVYAIDPSPANIAYINDVCKLNEVTNVNTICCALDDKNGNLSTSDNINHCTFVPWLDNENGDNVVISYSLDHLLSSRIISDVDYIHLDVEGMEHRVIRGAYHLISKCRPIITYEQHLNTDNWKELAEDLKSKNYTVYLIEEILKGCNPDCRNFIALPSEHYDLQRLHLIMEQVIKESVLTQI